MTKKPNKTAKQTKQTKETKKIEAILSERFPNARVYRYNIASIRIRVIDSCFEGMSRTEREEMVTRYLRGLPEETQADITVLLLLTPAEAPKSMMNIEFEDPSPSLV